MRVPAAAKRFAVSPSRISQVRREFQALLLAFHGEMAAAAAASLFGSSPLRPLTWAAFTEGCGQRASNCIAVVFLRLYCDDCPSLLLFAIS
jgi:hypothetical protein